MQAPVLYALRPSLLHLPAAGRPELNEGYDRHKNKEYDRLCLRHAVPLPEFQARMVIECFINIEREQRRIRRLAVERQVLVKELKGIRQRQKTDRTYKI